MAHVPPRFKGEKKKAGSGLRFRLPLSFRKQSGEAVEAPESPQLRYITGPVTVHRTHRYTLYQKHLHKQQPPKSDAADAFERELKYSPPKRLHLSQQLNLSAISLIGKVSHVLFREKKRRVHYACASSCTGARTRV